MPKKLMVLSDKMSTKKETMNATTFASISHLGVVNKQILKNLTLRSAVNYMQVVDCADELPFEVTHDSTRFKSDFSGYKRKLNTFEDKPEYDDLFVYGYLNKDEEFSVRLRSQSKDRVILKLDHGFFSYEEGRMVYSSALPLPTFSQETLMDKIVQVYKVLKSAIKKKKFSLKLVFYKQITISESPFQEFKVFDLESWKKEQKIRPEVYTTRRYGYFHTRYWVYNDQGNSDTFEIDLLKNGGHRISVDYRSICATGPIFTSVYGINDPKIQKLWQIAYSVYYNILHRTPKPYKGDVQALGDFKDNEIPMRPKLEHTVCTWY